MIILKLKNIIKEYNFKNIINIKNFEFEEDKTYIISGQSGTGKTTLLNIIASYINPDKGKVEFARNVSIGYLFQDEMLFSNLTVRENMFIKYNSLDNNEVDFEKNVLEILTKFNILDLVDRKVAMLSGGEKQRVQLANILLSNPDIILMDEPTSKLDEKNKQLIMQIINQVFDKKTLIIVSHETELSYNNIIKVKLEGGELRYEE